MRFKNFQKDGSFGRFTGTKKEGIIRGFYTMQSEGMISHNEYFLKQDGDAVILGIADDFNFSPNNDSSFIKNPDAVKYTCLLYTSPSPRD